MPTENRSSNSEIKPCPFCGEKAELRCTAGPDPDWFVQCTECRASTDVFSEDNLTGWNDRAHPPISDGFSAGDMADQGAKAFRDGQQPITELSDDLREILGRPNFTCHHIAQALRLMGRTIAKKSEDEQASVIHWMLGHYLKHGADWRQHASDELKTASQAA